MTFTAMINQVCDSRKATRTEWDDDQEYVLMQDDRLRIHTKKQYHDWIISYEDLLAEDWETI